MSCACDVVSEVWMALRSSIPSKPSAKLQIEMLMDQLSSRQVQLEILDKRCILEARRHRASGLRAQFRSKMLEHRRLQSQLTQLQRDRENALAQLDAVSNHEINQTFIRAIQGTGLSKNMVDVKKDTQTAIEDLQETVSNVREISDILGQPMTEDIDDDDLEQEFMDIDPADEIAVATTAPVMAITIPSVPRMEPKKPMPELRTAALFAS